MKSFVYMVLLAFAVCGATGAQAACPPMGHDKAWLRTLKASDWAVPDSERSTLALELTDCLASPDPELRDGLAFEGLDQLLRGNQLDTATVLTLSDNLQARLATPEGEGFERPFAALVLADVVRADRLTPFLTQAQRAELLDSSVAYFVGVRDYRGFDDVEGWRHGVAHGSDLLMQLALNPAFGKPELIRIRDAVATQVSPPGYFYIYGEGGRMARPILYMAQRGVFTEAEWTAWLEQVSAPAPLASWDEAFADNGDLARVHNINAFVQALYLNASLDSSPDDDVLLPGAKAALLSLP